MQLSFNTEHPGTCHTLTGVWVEITINKAMISNFYTSHPHGCVSWNAITWFTQFTGSFVTPSRVCELKSGSGYWFTMSMVSHPHGCVSWNFYNSFSAIYRTSHPHGCVSWNIQAILVWLNLKSHPHGCVSWNNNQLKFILPRHQSHPHGCVSWNCCCIFYNDFHKSHTLTGVWVEITDDGINVPNSIVTPSRVCELKSAKKSKKSNDDDGHTLTGVWVEIMLISVTSIPILSHPHGCVSWNSLKILSDLPQECHTLTGVWVEISSYAAEIAEYGASHPHGCVSWNLLI